MGGGQVGGERVGGITSGGERRGCFPSMWQLEVDTSKWGAAGAVSGQGLVPTVVGKTLVFGVGKRIQDMK